jgi:DNA-directed RNA polymerase subunit RPC12/RpoP
MGMSDSPGLQAREGPNGERLYVARDDAETGSKAPFFAAFRDESRERRWGYACGNCGSFSNAMDAMGRVQCNDCENFKRPDEWDAAHE